jgi:DNA polymerase elongation subunit (family B)
MQEDLADDEQRFYNVAVSASITGFVRAYMWDAMTKCENVMYCDTDSIICTDTGELDLHPTELGAWDVEAVGDYGGIAGKKLYALQTDNGEWKTASKGVRLDAHEILAVAKGKEIVFHPMNPQFSLKRGVRFQARKVKRSILA